MGYDRDYVSRNLKLSFNHAMDMLLKVKTYFRKFKFKSEQPKTPEDKNTNSYQNYR